MAADAARLELGGAGAREELAQQGGAVVLEDARHDLAHTVGQGAVAQQIVHTPRGTRLLIPCAEHDARDAGREDRPRAHDARFERDDERHIVEAPGSALLRRAADGDDLGVGRRIRVLLALVATVSEHRAVAIDDDGTHRHVARAEGELRIRERCSHGLQVGGHRLKPMRVHVADHPLITHKLTVLRDQRTPAPVFRALTEELVTLLAYEATRNVRTTEVTVQTPVAQATGLSISEPKPLVVPILRAGLGMLEGMVKLVPTAEVGFLGMVRDHETLEPTTYAERLPDDLSNRQCFVLDPMLATGGSLGAAIEFLFARGAVDVTAICILAAPEGIEKVRELTEGREVTLVLGAVDEKLNELGYIVPGLGDAGDRLYGLA